MKLWLWCLSRIVPVAIILDLQLSGTSMIGHDQHHHHLLRVSVFLNYNFEFNYETEHSFRPFIWWPCFYFKYLTSIIFSGEELTQILVKYPFLSNWINDKLTNRRYGVFQMARHYVVCPQFLIEKKQCHNRYKINKVNY